MSAWTKIVSDTSRRLSVLFKQKNRSPPPNLSDLAVPSWYRPYLSAEARRVFAGDEAVFFYLPWIAEHTDALIAKLGAGVDYTLLPFDLFQPQAVEDNTTRRSIFRFAQEHPDLYRKLVARRLIPLRGRISGMIFTFDWAPVTHVIANVCAELEIPRILIPHESVFVDRNKYYVDPTSRVSVPAADLVLGWGGLQRDIFLERGYPAERFHGVGAPKFDAYADYRPALTREQFCRLFGLRADRKLILFATQPLDSQLDTQLARACQREAISDLFEYAQAHDCQLLVRLPPSKDDVLGDALRSQLARSPFGSEDDARCYLVNPEEAIFHSDVVCSVNSTMLFEAALMGRAALSMKYVAFDQIWEKVGIPAAHDREEMTALLAQMLAGHWELPAEGMAWAADMFGVGTFDGRASARIGAVLGELASGKRPLALRADADKRLFAGENIDVVGVSPVPALSTERQPHLLALLGARTRVESENEADRLKFVGGVDVFVRWGMAAGEEERGRIAIARALGRPMAVLEHGLIGAAGTSLILDDTTAHYDAAGGSRLERWLAHGPELEPAEQERARRAIATIVAGRTPSMAPHAAGDTAAVRKILVVDQRTDDPAVVFGLAGADAFGRMLEDAVGRSAGREVVIALEGAADGTAGAGHLTAQHIAAAREKSLIVEVPAETALSTLMDSVDEVFTVSSRLGFDALMAGKAVHCHGAPFYAGWGLTDDLLPLEHRRRRRAVEDLFHAACIQLARYCDPRSGKAVGLEDFLNCGSEGHTR